MMATLADMRQVRVPRRIVEEIQDWLRIAGQVEREGVGFWAGVQLAEIAEVKASYIPRQVAVEADGGIMVVIPGDELFRMNVWLHQQGLTLIAQIHSHPGDAYHSDTDDEFAVMSRVGGLSIVVPDFAQLPFTLNTAAVYRLQLSGIWVALNEDEVDALITITG